MYMHVFYYILYVFPSLGMDWLNNEDGHFGFAGKGLSFTHVNAPYNIPFKSICL